MDTYHNTHCLEQKNGEVGIWTDNAMKMRYVYQMRRELQGENVSILEDMVTCNPYMKYETRPKEMLEKLRDQLTRYKLDVSEPDNPHGKTKVTASGKVNNEGKNSGTFRDDLATSFGIAVGVYDALIQRDFEWAHYGIIFPL